MADIRAFRALRPRPDLAARVASYPYDVISSDEARTLAKGNDISYLHVVKPEIDLPPDVDLYDHRVYAQGAKNLRRLVAEGVLIREAEPSLYVYQQRMGDHVQDGVVAACSCQEYADGLIKKHEFTRKDKEDDRTRHTSELNANDPVFLTYRTRPQIDAIVATVKQGKPVYDFVADDSFGHTVWVVPAHLTQGLIAAFREIPAMYVADGHHRAASGARVGLERKAANPRHTGEEPYNYFMAVVFPADQLRIMDYNRVVKDLNGRTPEAFLAEIAGKFTVTADTPARPEHGDQFGMYLGGR